jgi:hypothetical protein
VTICRPFCALGLEQLGDAVDARAPESDKVTGVTPASMEVIELSQPPEVRVSVPTEAEPESANIEQTHENPIGKLR